jgi:hypothetical protein
MQQCSAAHQSGCDDPSTKHEECDVIDHEHRRVEQQVRLTWIEWQLVHPPGKDVLTSVLMRRLLTLNVGLRVGMQSL